MKGLLHKGAARGIRRAHLLCLLAILALSVLTSSAAAEGPQRLWTTGDSCLVVKFDVCQEKAPAAPGNTKIPRGIASDPATGHIYVSDQGNQRVAEFDAWGQFVRAFGWDVAPEGAPGDSPADQMEVCTTDCQTGDWGSMPGQFSSPQSLAIDASGDLYVQEGSCCAGNNRIQKFDLSTPVPTFEWTIGVGVGQGPNHPGDFCSAQYVAEGDTCGIGKAPSGEFTGWPPVVQNIAVGPDGTLYVGEKGQIRKFDTAGTSVGIIAFTGKGEVGELPAPVEVGSLAIDSVSGDIYFGQPNNTFHFGIAVPDVLRIDPITGQILDVLAVSKPKVLATDQAGNVYVAEGEVYRGETDPQTHWARILQFNDAGNQIALFAERDFEEPSGLATGSGCLTSDADIYVANSDNEDSFVNAYGPPPNKLDGEGNPLCPAPLKPPVIESQQAVDSTPESTTVRAEINPNFWPDTTYYVEWGTGVCSEDGCPKLTPIQELGSGVVQEGVATAPVELAPLSLDTTYRYRFVAESTGGGPVYGEEQSLRSFGSEAAPNEACPNQSFRSGLAANLPDCRAYEMVSPLAKNGYDVDPGPVIARADGEGALFTSLGAFAGSGAGAQGSAYAVFRDPVSWSTEGLSPPADPAIELATGKVMGTSGDQTRQLLATTAKLTPEATGGDNAALNLYIRDSATGSLQFVATSHSAKKDGLYPFGAMGQFLFWSQFLGASEDGDFFAFYSESGTLGTVPDGEPLAGKLYGFDAQSGKLVYLAVAPDSSAIEGEAAGTSGPSVTNDEGAAAFSALSADGDRFYWRAINGGAIYLRRTPTAPESARQHGAATGSGDLIGSATATGTIQNGSSFVTKATTKTGSFALGQEITDTGNSGIPAGTTINAIEETSPGVFKLTLSQAATKTKATELAGLASAVVSDLETTSGGFQEGQQVSGPGVAPGATVVACAPACGAEAASLTLSAAAVDTKADGPLSATSPCTEAAKACTVAVSRRENGFVTDGEFWGASADGRYAFITSDGRLTSDAGPGGEDLYRYDAEADELTDLTPGAQGAGVSRVLGVSEDGAYAYFLAEGNLAPGAKGDSPKLYAWHEGDVRLISEIASGSGSLVVSKKPNDLWRTSPNGRYLAFLFAGALAGPHAAPAQPHAQAYLYDYGDDILECASCPPGSFVKGPVSLHGFSNPSLGGVGTRSFKNSEFGLTRNLTNSGQLFFQSPDRLLLRDTNGVQDVYEYSAGDLQLISSGQSPDPSYFGDASADGSDAFFLTREQLVGADTDTNVDLYDARVGGGLSSQRAKAASEACEGDACQGQASSPASVPGAGSSAFQGPGNPPVTKPKRPRCPKGKVRRKGRCVKKHRARHHKQQKQSSSRKGASR